MTKYIDAEKLKSIIKVQIKERKEWMKDIDKSDRQDQLWSDLNGEDMSILQTINSLQQEQPEESIPNDLEEAAVNIADALLAKPKDYALSAKADYWNGAHDGVIAGAKWQKQHDAELIEIAYNDGITIGMTKQREQMLKGAVEGEVMTNGFYPYEPRIVAPYPNCPYDFGDKVRIIIVKEDGK